MESEIFRNAKLSLKGDTRELAEDGMRPQVWQVDAEGRTFFFELRVYHTERPNHFFIDIQNFGLRDHLDAGIPTAMKYEFTEHEVAEAKEMLNAWFTNDNPSLPFLPWQLAKRKGGGMLDIKYPPRWIKVKRD